QRKLFYRNVCGIETESTFFREAVLFEPEMQFHDHSLDERKFIVLAEVFLHYHELEVAHSVAACEAFITADDVHFLVGDKVGDYFPEHEIDPWLHSEPETKVDTYDVVGNDVFNLILACVRIVHGVHVHEPIDIRPLWFFIQYRINDLMLYFLWIVRTRKVNEMRGVLGNGTVVAQFLN